VVAADLVTEALLLLDNMWNVLPWSLQQDIS